MKNRDMPGNASEWSDFLTMKPLPTGTIIGQQVLRSIRDKDLPYKKIAEQVNRDPVFSYYIMSEANRNKTGDTPGSKTLDHAISMIGIDRLRLITQKLPIQKADASDIQQFYYTRAMSASLLAAYLARTLSEFKKIGQKDDVYWGALFCGVPIWYLWRFATPEMRLVRYAIRSNFQLPEHAEREVLGCSILEVAQQLIAQLDVPTLTKESYSVENQLSLKQWIDLSKLASDSGKPASIDDKQINAITSRPAFAVVLSNLLAHYATHDWYSRSTLRIQKIISAYLGIPLSKAITLTHECAVEMSREHPLPGLMLPAAKLILPPRERAKAKPKPQQIIKPNVESSATETPQAATKEKTGTVEFTVKKVPEQGLIKPQPIQTESTSAQVEIASSADIQQTKPKRGNSKIFTEFTDIMLNNPDNFVDLHELMNAATQCMSYGLGMGRAVIALVNTNQTRLKAYYSTGTRDFPQLGGFQIDLTKPTLFSRLIEKPSSIWVKPTSSRNIWALIPPEFKKASGSQDFFLMSIFVNQKPVAIFFADSGDERMPCNEYEYKQFKYMCGAATQCLQYLATRRSKKPND